MATGQVDANGYGNSNVISLCQGEPYAHGKLALQLAMSPLLWPIKGQSVHHHQAKQNMNHSARSDRRHEHYSLDRTGLTDNTSKQTSGSDKLGRN